MSKIEAVTAWGWELEEGCLCYWADPKKETARRPSPKAKRVCVRIIRNSDWKKIQEKLREKP